MDRIDVSSKTKQIVESDISSVMLRLTHLRMETLTLQDARNKQTHNINCVLQTLRAA